MKKSVMWLTMRPLETKTAAGDIFALGRCYSCHEATQADNRCSYQPHGKIMRNHAIRRLNIPSKSVDFNKKSIANR